MATGTSQKRKRLMSIEDKVKIIELLDRFVSYSMIMAKFETGKSMVSTSTRTERKSKVFRAKWWTWYEETSKSDES